MKKTFFSLEGYEQIIKTVKATGNSGRVYIPAAWIGCDVAVIRISERTGGEDVNHETN